MRIRLHRICKDSRVRNLKKVANTLPAKRFNVYILFSKLGVFTRQEIERCKAAQDPYGERVIILGTRELEPLHVTDRIPKKIRQHTYFGTLADLARLTTVTYFAPAPLLMAKILQMKAGLLAKN
jgi:hypothetical protein